MTAGILGFGRLWPVIPGSPEDEATPVGLAPGQMPVNPARDGMIQPTAAGRNLSRAVGVVAGDAAHGLLSAATAPKRALDGDLPIFDPMTGHVSDEALGAGAGIAGLAMTGSLPFKAPAGAIRSFGGAAAKDDPLAALEAGLANLAPEAPPPGPRLLDPNAKLWDLYHGSEGGADFARFDPSKANNPAERGGLFLAPDPTTASGYAGSTVRSGAEAGPRVFRTTVEPGKTAIFDLPHLVERDPTFNAEARALTMKHDGATYGPVFDDAMSDFARRRDESRTFAAQAEAMGFTPTAPDGVPFGYGHIGAAMERAKAQGLDTAILRGLAEHGGDDQVVALTPGRVRSYYDPSQLLYAGAPVGVGLGAAMAAPDETPAIRPFGALPFPR